MNYYLGFVDMIKLMFSLTGLLCCTLTGAQACWGSIWLKCTFTTGRLERGFTRKRKLSLNEWQEDWVTFFSRQRLQLQLDMIEKDYGERETRELWSRLQVMQLVCQHLQMQFLKDLGIRDMFVLPVMNEFVRTHREVSLFIENF
uniref:Uncharacterized protein LOC116937171 isoform X3 n=1 Tax=Petromyzon marinus TaxID=7757 RepID=A0AAJ7WJK4_PETMA|nr:uncharacterized protein LOC116937171 isoform X3 [Petromyzon marinus]